MIGPDEIRARALRVWDSGRALRAWLGEEGIFPLSLVVGRPGAQALMEDFPGVRAQVDALEAHSRCALGHGYRIEYTEINHRRLGRQRLPRQVVFDEPLDLIQFVGRQREFRRFARLAGAIRSARPELQDWVRSRPLRVLEQGADWPGILAVLDHFVYHRVRGRYLRELDIPGVDTKFIETHRELLGGLLERVLPEGAIDPQVRGLAHHGFERRFGLRHEEPLIRFRILDPAVARLGGLSDLSVPLSQFQRLSLACRRVFITENRLNGLAFPDSPGAIVIFGLGYGLASLKDVPWLADREIHYWGDIDTHGLAMLSRLRGHFPQTRSLLMDRPTLEHFRPLWVREPASKRFTGELAHLDAQEQALYRELRDNALGENVRLEQERIAYPYVLDRVRALGVPAAARSLPGPDLPLADAVSGTPGGGPP